MDKTQHDAAQVWMSTLLPNVLVTYWNYQNFFLEAEACSNCEEVICARTHTVSQGHLYTLMVGWGQRAGVWVMGMSMSGLHGLHHDGPNWVGWAGVKLLLYINRKIARCQATLGCLQHSDLSLTSKGGAPHWGKRQLLGVSARHSVSQTCYLNSHPTHNQFIWWLKPPSREWLEDLKTYQT